MICIVKVVRVGSIRQRKSFAGAVEIHGEGFGHVLSVKQTDF